MSSDGPRTQRPGVDDSSCSQRKLAVLSALDDGERRFNELRASTGASSPALSRAVEDLVADGLVARRVDTDAPASSHYRLTERGRALGGAVADRGASGE